MSFDDIQAKKNHLISYHKNQHSYGLDSSFHGNFRCVKVAQMDASMDINNALPGHVHTSMLYDTEEFFNIDNQR